MKKLILMAMPLILCAASLKAQQISGMVKDEQGKTLSGATVSLKKAQDSSLVKLGATGKTGQYTFTGIGTGKYFVAISYIGYVPKATPAFEVGGTGDVNVAEVSLTKASQQEMKG